MLKIFKMHLSNTGNVVLRNIGARSRN